MEESGKGRWGKKIEREEKRKKDKVGRRGKREEREGVREEEMRGKARKKWVEAEMERADKTRKREIKRMEGRVCRIVIRRGKYKERVNMRGEEWR